ncbi:MAG TPA: AAA family ATPase [Terriglobales bacterium]|jgi:predicted ATPase|nr:AAA family ATPase [Terriglobales bacterium]
MSIQAIRLRNFRGFRDVTLPLKPLTVLLGPNSSGKSSFGHALAAMAHSQKRDPGGQRPSLTPKTDPDEWPIDLGSTNDLRTRGESGRVYVGLEMTSGSVEFGFGELPPSPNDLILSYLSHPFNVPLMGEIVESRLSSDRSLERESSSDVVPVSINDLPDLSPNRVIRRDSENIWWDETENKQSTVDLDGLLVRSMKHEGGTSFAPQRKTLEATKNFLNTLTYLRASRKRPSRNYLDRVGEPQRIGYAGEWTPAVLRENGGDRIRFPQPPGTPSGIAEAKTLINKEWATLEVTLFEGIGYWLQQLQLANSVVSVPNPLDKRRLQVSLTLPGQQQRNITEIGFGVSQVLPVITAGLMQTDGSLFIVDLPEAHLHPLPQARLADFFCSLALTGHHTLVETHSEMFFHWLRLRAEMNDQLHDKIAVYFVDRPAPDGCCKDPQLVGLTGDSQLRWPLGFFEEAWNIESLIKYVRDARSSTYQ